MNKTSAISIHALNCIGTTFLLVKYFALDGVSNNSQFMVILDEPRIKVRKVSEMGTPQFTHLFHLDIKKT